MNKRIDLTENSDFREEKININSHIENFMNLDDKKLKDDSISFFTENIITYIKTHVQSIYFSGRQNKDFNPFEYNNDVPQTVCYRCGTEINGFTDDIEATLCRKCNELLSKEYDSGNDFEFKKTQLLNDDFIRFERMIWW